MVLSQKEHCGAAPNHVQTQASAALQHHPLLPPHLPHLGAALCQVGGLVQGARPAEVGVSIDVVLRSQNLSPHFVLAVCQRWRKVLLNPFSFWY